MKLIDADALAYEREPVPTADAIVYLCSGPVE